MELRGYLRWVEGDGKYHFVTLDGIFRQEFDPNKQIDKQPIYPCESMLQWAEIDIKEHPLKTEIPVVISCKRMDK